MALTRFSGERVTSSGDQVLYYGAGRLMGLLASHKESSFQTITFKDDDMNILTVYILPDSPPLYINFAKTGGKLEGIPFTHSLVASKGSNAELNVWYLGY